MKTQRNSRCWCGSGKKYKQCHEKWDDRYNILKLEGHTMPARSLIKSPEDLRLIRKAAAINNGVLDLVAERIHAGMTTEDINTLVHNYTVEHGGIPAPLNYEGFPKSVCTSLNDEVCHGIPSKDVVLRDGDIINVDVTTILDGYYGDASRMYCIGNVSPEAEKLVRVTKESVDLALKEARAWGHLGDIGAAISEYIYANGFTVVREIGGHGVGLEFHEDPWVSYTSEENSGVIMEPGMMFTIEPMVNMGSDEVYTDEEDDWTVRTEDGMPSAQWEVTVLVTEDGCEVICW